MEAVWAGAGNNRHCTINFSSQPSGSVRRRPSSPAALGSISERDSHVIDFGGPSSSPSLGRSMTYGPTRKLSRKLSRISFRRKSSKKTDLRRVTEEDPRIRMNVSGMRFETLQSTLARFPDSLLGNPEKREAFFDPERKEYFFHRDRKAFEAILYYYQSEGKLLKPSSVDADTFCEELKFFQLGEEVVRSYCISEGMSELEMEQDRYPYHRYLKVLWHLFEYPNSSWPARFLAVWSVCAILVSVIVFCIETMPYFKDHRVLQSVEIGCIVWFTFEYVIRIITAPAKCKFLGSFMNFIDLLAIIPYFIAFGLRGNKNNASVVSLLRVLRLLRVFRILKLSRHYRGLKVLGLALRASARELFLLIFLLVVGVVIFSSGVYYLDSGFSSIPDAFWWAIITMTTVGYGDLIPTTTWGKLVGSLCAIGGVLSLALPVPILVANFSYFYYQDKRQEQVKLDP